MTYLIVRHHALRRICPTTWCSEFTWAQFHNHSSPSSLQGSINVYSNKKDGSRDEPALNAVFTGKFIYFPAYVSHSICYRDFTFWPETKHGFLVSLCFLSENALRWMLRNAEHNVWPTLHKMSFWLTAFVLDCIWKVRLALSHYCLWILAYKGWNLSDVERMALTCNVWYLRNLSRFSTGGPNSSKSVEEWFQLLQTVLSP